MPRTFTYPRDFRREEFLSSSDLNAFVSEAIRSLEARPAARIVNVDTEGQAIGSGSFTDLEFNGAMFDQGLWDRGSRLVVQEEGLYLFALNAIIAANTSGVRLAAIELNGGFQIARTGAFPGHGSRMRLQTWGVWYCYPGDVLNAALYQSSGSDLLISPEPEYGTHLWGVQLTAGKTVETWTSPVTWSSGNIPTDTQLRQQIRENFRFLRSRPAARILRAATNETLSISGLWFTLHPDTPTIDSTATKMWSSATSHALTIRRTGIYLIGGCAHIAANASGVTGGRIFLNGNPALANMCAQTLGIPGNSGHGGRPNLIGLRSLTSGDTLQLEAFQDSTVSLDSVFHREHAPVLWACMVSDTGTPPTVTDPKIWARLDAATHTDLNTNLKDWLNFLYGPPACRAKRTSAQSISNDTATKVSFPTQDFDNDAMFAPTDTKITMTRGGLYLIGCHVPWASNATGTRRVVRITKNSGSTIIGYQFCFPGVSSAIVEPCLTLHRFVAGDFVEVEVEQNSGAALNVDAANNICDFWAVRLGA